MHSLIELYLPCLSTKPSGNYNTEQGQKEWCRQRAKVKLVQNETVFLTLPNETVVCTQLVVCRKPDGSLKQHIPLFLHIR